jgi:hypothetical protein
MPPPGGFEPVKYKRNIPMRGPGGLVILLGITAVCGYGFYRVGLGNLEKRQVFFSTAVDVFIRSRKSAADFLFLRFSFAELRLSNENPLFFFALSGN